MAMNESSNLLLGAAHYNRFRPPCQHQNSLNEPAVQVIENNDETDRRASSVQSLQSVISSSKPLTAVSYPRLQYIFPKPFLPPTRANTLNTTTSSSSSKHTTISVHNSVSPIDDLSSSTKIRTQDENKQFVKNNSIDECDVSTHLLKSTTPTLPENDENEKILDKKDPIEIRVRCIFSRVGEIDTLNERYTAEIFFEASWFDESQKIGSKYDPQMGHFNPQLVVLNHIGDSLRHEKWYSTNKTDDDNITEITEYHKIRGVFWERMELNHFPYDVQELSLSITTPLTKNDLFFIQNLQKPSGVNRTVFSDQQSWHLYEHVEFSHEEHREEYSLTYNQLHPVVVCTCHVGRKCGYYIWNAYFLIFLITSAALCTFAIPPSNTHGRLQITCTLLLTSVTFRWVVNKSLPTISYLTALDVYAISSIVALCIINVFHGIISYIYYNQLYLATSQPTITTNSLHLSLYPEYSLCRLDRIAFFVFLSIFFVYQVLILIWTFWVPYKRRYAMSHKDEENRAQLLNKIS
ncbi:unnamed protein product [Adineta steineri]|uniref:Uncharacterized protein n=1 Tax=Adineta steineri TaxID=433720 RepID=A0A818PLS0_9BILA|nr:unnamed protein product [Adineta steineri]CAF3623157.1 unnamed protein product [Adineta steineri]